ncbi:8-amino-7-oxononanoate synthase [candidate division WOR-3 bacterium 4484_100]|uniref:8-amino-7-oxononanoate synthase n=1 Tax=candidate division WOR-3 bacterium 4484_100 TaxID=1936077 RepID=A0A1V4QIE3_UNCW3|nr:MAG: 8-amino-7-oxononanoate synthase [candidate division WOR-3 bacterium 4484_100]
MDIFKKCEATVKEVERAHQLGIYPYFTPIESVQDHRVMIDGREFIMIGSNGYLGLAADPRIKQAAIKAVERYGSTCSGSRFLNGTLDIHVNLEKDLANFFNKDGAIIFSTGFQTNLGIISAIAGKDDIILIDRQNHASIIDGCRLSFAELKKYRHNDMEDLERIMKSLPDNKGRLIIVDGVFSMEGELADLPELVKLKHKYNARLMVDDAHGIGVLGENGQGTCEHFGLLNEVDIIMGTFSKSFAFWEITERILKGFKEIGLDTGKSQTPVIPVIIGEDEKCFAFWKKLFKEGIFANPVISPATPPGRALIRTSYMTTHTDEDIKTILDVFQRCAREFGLV